YATRLAAKPLRFASDAVERLIDYDWPGNVRELENCVQHLLVLHRDGEEIGSADLPDMILSGSGSDRAPRELHRAVEDFERDLIQRTLGRCGGNRERAAQELGISLRNLYQKLRRYGLGGRASGGAARGAPP